MIDALLRLPRRWIWTGGLLLLTLFAVRSRFFNPWLDVATCLAAPEAHHGRTVTYLREPRIGPLQKNGFWLLQKGAPDIFVKTDTTGLKPNDYIGLVATFHRDGYLVAVRQAPATRRRMKIAVSVIPLLFLTAWSLAAVRRARRTLPIEDSRHA